MPGRVSRSSLPTAPSRITSKNNKKRKQRSQNAFAIASHEQPDLVKIRQHRLGEVEDDEPRNKRQRMTGDEEDGIEQRASESQRQQQRNVAKGRFDELDISEGSDSEGHEWTLGRVDDDDDSDVDSDEAFGEGDEERFADYAFRGGSGGRKTKRKKTKQSREPGDVEVNLDEDEEIMKEDGGDEDEDDLGDDAVDLAQMLDDDLGADSEEDSNNEPQPQSSTGLNDGSLSMKKKKKKKSRSPAEDDTFGGFESGDDFGKGSETSRDEEDIDLDDSVSNDDSDDNAPEKLQQLQDVVASLPRENGRNEQEQLDSQRNQKPDRARLLASLQSMPNLDPALSRSLKKITRSADPKSGNPDGLVKVPLPKRQQDKVDRGAAYQKAKETLNRWVDTVKHNRRAEHLHFPMQDPQEQEARGTSRLLPTGSERPRNELEEAIQNILKESGMGARDSNFEEDQLIAAEGLETRTMPVEEVMARRAELRKARELLFREEKRAKRIKKIKSKAYRRVHRKDREKAAQQERDLLTAAGLDLSEDEKERIDKRRAEERMGGRHRDSRWAKGMKHSGRTVWDEQARSGVADMAARNEDLRRRIDGENVHNGSDSGSNLSSSESDDEDNGEEFRLRDQLEKVGHSESGNTSQLASLKFMQRAEAARQKQNDEEVEQIRRELDGEDSASESDAETTLGRRMFGPTETTTAEPERQVRRNELEEGYSSEENNDESRVENQEEYEDSPADTDNRVKQRPNAITLASSQESKSPSLPSHQIKAFKDAGSSSSGKGQEKASRVTPAAAPHDTSSWVTVPLTSATDDTSSDEGAEAAEAAAEEPLVPSNADLVAAAFGGADVEADFQGEKQDAAESEDDKVTDNTLPGWGSWTGEGISKRDKRAAAQKRQQGKFITREAGVKPSDRKDAKLDRAIISEKRAKKNAKYLAKALPHPFESKQQYERALRMPVGPEWTTKETFQDATMPRVMVKQGIIKPIQRPMI